MDPVAIRLVIRGHVQGVGYRWWARGVARRLKLTGWVRNLVDGAVELLAVGPPAMVERMADACRRGPAGAEVTALERFEAEAEDLDDFAIRT